MQLNDMAVFSALLSFFSAASRMALVLSQNFLHSASHALPSPFGGVFLPRAVASSFHALADLAASSHFSPLAAAEIVALKPSLPKLFFMTSLISASAALAERAAPYEATMPITPMRANTPDRNSFLTIETPFLPRMTAWADRATVTRSDARLYQTRGRLARINPRDSGWLRYLWSRIAGLMPVETRAAGKLFTGKHLGEDKGTRARRQVTRAGERQTEAVS